MDTRSWSHLAGRLKEFVERQKRMTFDDDD